MMLLRSVITLHVLKRNVNLVFQKLVVFTFSSTSFPLFPNKFHILSSAPSHDPSNAFLLALCSLALFHTFDRFWLFGSPYLLRKTALCDKRLFSLSEMGFHGSDGGNGKAAVGGADDEKVVVGKARETPVDVVTDDEHEDEVEDVAEKIHLGPRTSIKEQLEKDKDDESLRKWKEQLLGSLDIAAVGGDNLEPDVKILNLAIKSDNRPDIVLEIPETGNPKGLWFTLKEGSRYSLNFSFKVKNNIVSGLRYTNTVWKTGIKVDRTKEMLGTFSPQADAYTHEMPEEVTPSGMFARGTYSARTKFFDDDKKCYLEINYTFDIRKDWNYAQ